jgi:hypothetical protein
MTNRLARFLLDIAKRLIIIDAAERLMGRRDG